MASVLARHKGKCELGGGKQTVPRAKGCTCTPTYYVVVDPTQKGGRVRIGTVLKDAERRKAEIEKEQDRGEYEPIDKLLATVWLDRWLVSLDVAETTRLDYETTVAYAQEAFAGKYLHQLRVSDADRFFALMVKETTDKETKETIVRPVSASTRGKHFRVLHKALEDARKRNHLGRNPLRDMERPKAKRREAAYFTNEELPRLWAAARAHDLPLFKLAYMTGLRVGELLGLRWRNVNLTNRAIDVREQYSEKLGTFGLPKTDAGRRTVYLSPESETLLSRWYTDSGRPDDDALVFPKQRTRQEPRRSTSVLANLHRAMERAGIPEQGATGKRGFHSFRHSYAKAVLEREPPVSFKWLQEQLGHSDLKTTMDTYGHFEAATKKAVAASLEGAFQL